MTTLAHPANCWRKIEVTLPNQYLRTDLFVFETSPVLDELIFQ